MTFTQHQKFLSAYKKYHSSYDRKISYPRFSSQQFYASNFTLKSSQSLMKSIHALNNLKPKRIRVLNSLKCGWSETQRIYFPFRCFLPLNPFKIENTIMASKPINQIRSSSYARIALICILNKKWYQKIKNTQLKSSFFFCKQASSWKNLRLTNVQTDFQIFRKNSPFSFSNCQNNIRQWKVTTVLNAQFNDQIRRLQFFQINPVSKAKADYAFRNGGSFLMNYQFLNHNRKMLMYNQDNGLWVKRQAFSANSIPKTKNGNLFSGSKCFTLSEPMKWDPMNNQFFSFGLNRKEKMFRLKPLKILKVRSILFSARMSFRTKTHSALGLVYKMFYRPRPSAFSVINNPITVNPFGLEGKSIFFSSSLKTYHQKWNGKSSMIIQNFSTSVDETNIKILAKRQRFLNNSLKGILLVNFPEKEKSFLIKNLAAENKIPLITQSASLLLKDSRNMDDLLGVDDPIQILFDKVKTCIPCICFINNLDRIGKQRYEQEQKSLHWLNNSISLLIDNRLTNDGGFKTINQKKESVSIDTNVLSNKASVFDHDFKKMAILKRLKTFQINTFKNAQNRNQKVLKYLTYYGQHPNKSELQPIRSFFNLLIRLSIWSGSKRFTPGFLSSREDKMCEGIGWDPKDSIYKNRWKQTSIKFFVERKIASIVNFSSMFDRKTLDPSLRINKFVYYRCFFKKMSYLQTIDLKEKYNTYQEHETFRLSPLILGSTSYVQNIIWNKRHYYLLKKKPFILSTAKARNKRSNEMLVSKQVSIQGFSARMSFRTKTHSALGLVYKMFYRPKPNPSFVKTPFNRVFNIFDVKNTDAESTFSSLFVASGLWRRNPKSGINGNSHAYILASIRDKGLTTFNQKLNNSYYHRLPFWLFKISSFSKYKITIGRTNWLDSFYNLYQREEESILTSRQWAVNSLPLQMTFSQTSLARTEPIFEKPKYKTIGSHSIASHILSSLEERRVSVKPLEPDPKTRFKDAHTSYDRALFKNSVIKSDNIEMFEKKSGLISKTNRDYVISNPVLKNMPLNTDAFFVYAGKQKRPKRKLNLKDLGNIDIDKKKISSIAEGLSPTLADIQAFSASPKNKPLASEPISNQLTPSTPRKINKNNSLKITETDIIKRTALLKFLQILDGFHTSTGTKKPVSFFYLNLGLFKNRYMSEIFLTLSKKIKPKPSKLKIDSKQNSLSIKAFFTPSALWSNQNKSKMTKTISHSSIWNKNSFTVSPIVKNHKAPKQKNYNLLGNHPYEVNLENHFINITRFKKLEETQKSSMYSAIMLCRPKNDFLSHTLQKKTFESLLSISKMPKWEIYLKNQPSLKSLNLLCVWPSSIEDRLGPSNFNDGASYILPEYFQLLGHGPKLKKQGITLIASTNNLTTLDAALLRPGRFDTVINFSHSFSSIYKSFKMLKHSPSLTQDKYVSLSKSSIKEKNVVRLFKKNNRFLFNPNTILFSSISLMNIHKVINNQFYPQIIILDILNPSTPIKTFVDVSIFIQSKLWWSFNNGKLSWLRLDQKDLIRESKTRVQTFERFKWIKSSTDGVILVLKYKIKAITYMIITILQMIHFRLFYHLFQFFIMLRTKLTKKTKFTTETLINQNYDSANTLSRKVLISKAIADYRFSPLFVIPRQRQGTTKSEINDQWELSPFISKPSELADDRNRLFSVPFVEKPKQKPRSNLNPLNRDTWKLPKNLDSLDFFLDQYHLPKTEAWKLPNSRNKTTQNFTSNLHIEYDNMFLKYHRRLLFCTGDFDYKVYSEKNSDIVLTYKNQTKSIVQPQPTPSIKNKKLSSYQLNTERKKNRFPTKIKSKFDDLVQSIEVSGFFLDQSFKIWKPFQARFSKNVNLDHVMLTKYKEIYKLKVLKSKQQSFFNLHPFSSFMLKRWPQVMGSQCKTSFVWDSKQTTRSYLDYQTGGFESACYTKSNKLKRHLKNGLVEILPFSYNQIYHNLHSATLLVPTHVSLLKNEPSKTLATDNFFSTVEFYLFRKIGTNSSLNITCLQIDPTFIDLEKEISNEFFGYRLLPRKNWTSSIDLSKKENWLKKIPRRTVINYRYSNCQTTYKVKTDELEINNNIILVSMIKNLPLKMHASFVYDNKQNKLKNHNLVSNEKKEDNFARLRLLSHSKQEDRMEPQTPELVFQKYKMCRLDVSFFLLIFYTMFFEKIQHKNVTLNTIKIFMPYKSLIFSHFLLSQSETYGFSCKNFEMLIYNKFKNVFSEWINV